MIPFQDGGMPSDDAYQLIRAAICVLRKRRESMVIDDNRWEGKKSPMSIRHLCEKANLDPAALSRAEAVTDKDRIPSFAFFVDWAKALDSSIEEVVQEAREQLEKDSNSDE